MAKKRRKRRTTINKTLHKNLIRTFRYPEG